MIGALFRLAFWPVLLPFTLLRRFIWRLAPRKRLVIELEGRHLMRAPPGPIWARPTLSLDRGQLTQIVEAALRDPRVPSVRFRIGRLTGPWAELQALRGLISRVRAGGKSVSAYVADPDTRTLWVASAAERVWLPRHTSVMATGLAAELRFFGPALSGIGIDLEVVTAGRFKSALEPLTRAGPTPANREAIEALIGDLEAQLIGQLAQGRGLTEDAARAALTDAPIEGEAAILVGLADALVDEEDLDETLDEAEGPARPLSALNYGGRPRAFPRLRRARPRLAVVEIVGDIRDGNRTDPHPTGACTRAVVEALEAAAEDKGVRGVLLRINSRGGSANASEHIWRAVRRLAGQKPVIASLGDVAASGGYYIASAAHGIVAEPGTITGSIGVIAAKPVVRRLLDRLGVHTTLIERGERGAMYSPTAPFTGAERASLERSIASTYALFLQRVATGRGKRPDDIAPHAEGRVWTGRQALERGLIDRLGDETAALEWLAGRAGMPGKRAARLIGPSRRWWRALRPVGVRAADLRTQLLDQLAAEAELPLALWRESPDTPWALCPWDLTPR